MENAKYIGWIPCVNGHLDFGLMRVGISGRFSSTSESKDENSITVNYSKSEYPDSHARRIVLQSWVDWRDSEEYHKDSGKFRVIVTAEVNESNSMDDRYLQGNILIYPMLSEPQSSESRARMEIHRLCHDVQNTTDSIGRNSYFEDLEQLTCGLKNIQGLTNYFCCSLKFEIFSNGITYISFNKNSKGVDNETTFIIARQAYYYLKYSIHTHKHHTATQDSLTTITPLSRGSQKDLNEAGLRLICQLKRELTILKRIQNTDGREHPTNNAVGIIAYIKSLILSLSNSSIIDKDMEVREIHRFSHLRESFLAQSAKIENVFSNSELVKSKSKVWLGFIIVSLWGTLNFAFKGALTEEFEINSPVLISGLFIFFALVFLIYQALLLYYRKGLNPEETEKTYKYKYWQYGRNAVLVLSFAIILHLIASNFWSSEQFGNGVIFLFKIVSKVFL